MNSILKSTKYFQSCINIISIENLNKHLEDIKYYGILNFICHLMLTDSFEIWYMYFIFPP